MSESENVYGWFLVTGRVLIAPGADVSYTATVCYPDTC